MAATRKVNSYVHLTDPESGQRVVLEPGDKVPDNLKDAVGEHALESADESEDVVTPVAGPGQSALDADTLRQIREAREAEAERAKAEAKEAADKEAAENEAKRLKAEADAAAEQEKAAKPGRRSGS